MDPSPASGAEEGGHTGMGMARMVKTGIHIPDEEQSSKLRLAVFLQCPDVRGLAASLVEGSDDALVLLGILEAVDMGRLRHTSVEVDGQEDAVTLRPWGLE